MTSTILMEAITPTVLPGEPKAPGEGSYMRDQRTGDVPPTGSMQRRPIREQTGSTEEKSSKGRETQ